MQSLERRLLDAVRSSMALILRTALPSCAPRSREAPGQPVKTGRVSRGLNRHDPDGHPAGSEGNAHPLLGRWAHLLPAPLL
ncbi:MAG: hypothetical protein MZU79_08705 [Anaerotruncus sp.]|nr:hypothetical protein [Anaerotruncus sp.]